MADRSLATVTATPTATTTPEPESDEIVLSLAESAEYETQDTTVDIEFTLFEDRDDYAGVDAEEHHSFVIAHIGIENTGNSDLRIATSQWSLLDHEDDYHSTHEEAMTAADDAFPIDARLDPDESGPYAVVFEVRRVCDLEILLEPYLGTEGPTVRLDPPAQG